MTTHFPKVRTQIEKTLITWHSQLESIDGELLILRHRRDGLMNLTLPGLNSNIGLEMTASEFLVYVEWQGEYWDLLVGFQVLPVLTEAGYINAFTQQEYRVLYTSRAQLWREEMFNPLITWIKQKLKPAQWIGFYVRDGGHWAEFIQTPDNRAFNCLQVWTS